jgi:hypothetical protein
MSEIWGEGGGGQEKSLDSVNFVTNGSNNLIVLCISLLTIPLSL